MSKHLIWFRQDLRISDHSALWHATQDSEASIALVIISPEQWRIHHDATYKINFYLRQLKVLREQLASLNIPLLIQKIDHWADVPKALVKLTTQLDVSDVYANAELGWNERTRDQATEEALAQEKIKFHLYQDRTIFPVQSLRTQSDGPYKVFGAFKRVCYDRLEPGLPPCYSSIEKQPEVSVPKELEHQNINLDQLLKDYAVSQDFAELWPVGEDIAHQKLAEFIQDDVQDYDSARDTPAIHGTSQLSAYLNIGILSVRHALNELFIAQHGEFSFQGKGQQTWLDELLWREFYQHILYDFPKVSKHLPFKDDTKKVKWRDAEEDFEKWTQGKTGIPIVDAGMQQLLQTGWMHNRVRMITAMFLSKNLLIDWRKGEQWFMQHLIDGELAANNGGWQWSASTGTDSVPYFRIFNPVTQSQRFDPNGEYIKTWLPELKSLSNKDIHAPYDSKQKPSIDYPEPIVDLKSSRARAIDAFKNL